MAHLHGYSPGRFTFPDRSAHKEHLSVQFICISQFDFADNIILLGLVDFRASEKYNFINQCRLMSSEYASINLLHMKRLNMAFTEYP